MTSIRKSLPSKKTFLGRTFDVTSRELDSITDRHMAENPPRTKRRSDRRRAKVSEARNKTKMRINKPKLMFESADNRVYNFEASKGSQRVTGDLVYNPGSKALSVTDIGDVATPGAENYIHSELHSKVKNKAMSKAFTRELLSKTAKAFPKADTLEGYRITGAHAKAAHAPNALPEAALKTQKFNLARIRGMASKIGRASKFFAPVDVFQYAREMKQGEKIREQRRMKEGLIPGKT